MCTDAAHPMSSMQYATAYLYYQYREMWLAGSPQRLKLMMTEDSWSGDEVMQH